jgi:hypothetical protein
MAPWALGNAQVTSYVLPQLAFGGGWYSALYFTNQNNAATSFTINFFTNTGAPLLAPVGGTSVASTLVNVPANGTALVETPNVGALNQGYAAFVLPAGITGYGILGQIVGRHSGWEALVPFVNVATTTNTIIWDDTSAQTQVALVNASSINTVVAVTALDGLGNTLATSSVPLPANNQIVSTLESLPGLSGLAGQRGSAQFLVNTGNVSVLALRSNGLSFTSIPVASDIPQANPVPFNVMHINAQFAPLDLPAELVNYTIAPTNGGTAYMSTFPEGVTLVGGTVTNQQGQVVTLNFTTLQATPNTWYAALNVVLPDVASGSMTLTITPVSTDPTTGVTLGNVSGLLTVTGTTVAGNIISLSGPIFGTYVEPPAAQQ